MKETGDDNEDKTNDNRHVSFNRLDTSVGDIGRNRCERAV
jgi:hypothetical protein